LNINIWKMKNKKMRRWESEKMRGHESLLPLNSQCPPSHPLTFPSSHLQNKRNDRKI
jgi:hypothetical protein